MLPTKRDQLLRFTFQIWQPNFPKCKERETRWTWGSSPLQQGVRARPQASASVPGGSVRCPFYHILPPLLLTPRLLAPCIPHVSQDTELHLPGCGSIAVSAHHCCAKAASHLALTCRLSWECFAGCACCSFRPAGVDCRHICAVGTLVCRDGSW